METGDRRVSIQRERYLETFLGGMETPALEEISLLGVALDTFLGGMETPQLDPLDTG